MFTYSESVQGSRNYKHVFSFFLKLSHVLIVSYKLSETFPYYGLKQATSKLQASYKQAMNNMQARYKQVEAVIGYCCKR